MVRIAAATERDLLRRLVPLEGYAAAWRRIVDDANLYPVADPPCRPQSCRWLVAFEDVVLRQKRGEHVGRLAAAVDLGQHRAESRQAFLDSLRRNRRAAIDDAAYARRVVRT